MVDANTLENKKTAQDGGTKIAERLAKRYEHFLKERNNDAKSKESG